MVTPNIEHATGDISSRPKYPVNLTAATETMSWELARKVIGLTGPSEKMALEVRCMSHAESDHVNNGQDETVYVVISGYGVLRSDDSEMQCTAGDVLFVPRGCSHHFERLDGDIRIWRISPVMQ